MFHKILVAIDHSELGQHVFDEALILAKPIPASLVLLNVLSPEDEASPSSPVLIGYEAYPSKLSKSIVEIYQELWQSYADRESELLQSLTDAATTAGVDATFRQSFGNPGRIICELACELDVDLIMLGRHGRSGLNELILGSVSNYVLHHAPCSVLTIHRQDQNAGDRAEAKQVAMAS
ncbi:universal stress protein [Stenomitos frigidus]|uniref:Universal stress protein n=1 Tax=Stenomitos frigidus ULC18 TaxID=2107698 RepID=A0A2T1EQ91_9CYAN|nr:universal stress protein [Stenomitos frigidus]PSB34910.1 universal stress protein [Stenomitos frigidus ULC18]